ncbi:beta-fructofuranosidase, insoluble isoenzyme CWINV1 [Cornus florida]|uniref:beta-fructofuranosidase, insoluble isoenzyme CWINV1 n=1 Tax=Cornus florida TaxID=4283 RepID=UPI0028963B52|nr:beta-fructofuranosidase, insoluble isoenzyme CWINV1 [Cornus florida]
MEISVVWILGIYFVPVFYGFEVEARNLQSPQIEQPYRTAYHFQPPKNWMNDPNGPMYYKGVYHLFYQYNPYGALWGNIVWGHSISYDLINWVHLDHAIYPSDPFDINGCWSGSVTILPGDKPAILYTGADTKKNQVQNLAVPKNLSDPLLREWVKSNQNPLMTPIDGIDPNFFRDPTTAWQGPDRKWRVIIGSQINGHGTALLYQSLDFVTWTRSQKPLHSSNKTIMWECPDFYPVNIHGKNGVDTSMQGGATATKHVLKASFNSSDYYVVGNYEPKTDQYLVVTDFMDGTQPPLRYDYGKFYASKTFYDSAKQRRILWGWINESDRESDDIKKGWSGLQSIPRSIWLGKNGRQLVQWPIKEIEKLHGKQVNIHNKELEGGSVFEVVGITASQADVEVSFDLPNLQEAEFMDLNLANPQLLCSQKTAYNKGVIGPFGLLALASNDLTEQTAIFFRIFKSQGKYAVLMCSDQSRSSLIPDLDKTTYGAFVDLDPLREKISLRSLIDHSIVESFGGEGRTCITARVYPSLAIGEEAHLYVFNNGSQSVKILSLSGWSMKKAQIVPIQKRRKPPIN